MSEEKINLQGLKSNQEGQREVFLDQNIDMAEQQMSPGIGRRFDFS
jgi:hypothetical protein